MWSAGNSRDVKNARRSERALFRPSFGIPSSSFFIIGGYMFSVIVRPFRLTPFPSCFFSTSFGLFCSASFSAFVRSKAASPSIEFGMKFFILVILSGSASEGLKFSIWSFESGIEA